MLVPIHSPAPIAVIGMQYVGRVTAACLAELGHHVIGLDVDPDEIDQLPPSLPRIHEPGLSEIVQRQLAAGRLRFTSDYAEALRGARIVFVCVCTSAPAPGTVDMTQIHATAEGLGRYAQPGTSLIVVIRSTVPVGTGEWLEHALRSGPRGTDVRFTVVSNPEFLRAGLAVADFLRPDRVVLGGRDAQALDRVAALYDRLNLRPPVIRTDLRTAELIKYASNGRP